MGLLNRFRASPLGELVRAPMRRELRRFLDAARNCRAQQQQALRDLIALNGDSEFAVDRGLHTVHTPADLRRRMPVTRYDDYAAGIERMKAGRPRALLGSRNKLLMFSLSSGTTSGSKYIPITGRFLKDYKRGWQIWGIQAFDRHPAMNARNIVQLSSDYDRYRTTGGVPCGNISGLVAAMQKHVVKSMYTVPGAVAKIADPETKNYTTLRLALADANIGLVMTANPSTLIHLARTADRRREELIRDVADGTLSVRSDIPPDVLRALRRPIGKSDKRRARELERIVERTGTLYPRDYWPAAELVAVWTGGSAGAYLNSLRKYYGDITVRDHGLSASEGRMTIPVEDGTAAGILDVTTHYFEFIPEDEYENEHPTVLEAHELEEGCNYFILLTTSSGFYRYDICDVVRCTGFYGTTPLLEFLHKGAHISNITGEKISESQVVAAVSGCLAELQIELRHFTVTPVWSDPPYYQVLAEERDFPAGDVVETFLKRVDARLQEINCEYRDKRQTGRLAEMGFLPLPEGTWRQFTRYRQQSLGGSLEQYKHPCLVPDVKFGEQFLRQFADSAA
jgi:GH3 auxin-responsive promoter